MPSSLCRELRFFSAFAAAGTVGPIGPAPQRRHEARRGERSAADAARRFRLGAWGGEEAAALGRGGEIDPGPERKAILRQHVLGGEILGEGRLALAQM